MKRFLKFVVLLTSIFCCCISIFAMSDNLEKEKISVIVPVYNVEKYLDECLSSIVNQTYKNLEIICINDGSTDNSLKILERYQDKDKRITIINQENHGVSYARNVGINLAKGSYISFVDPDDIIALNTYETAINKMEHDVDILIWGYNSLPNSAWWAWAGISPNLVCNTQTAKAFFEGKNVSVVVWNKLYKISMLKENALKFDENLSVSEDVEFNMLGFPMAKKIQFISDKLYNYRIKREGSLTDTHKQNNLAKNHRIMFETVLKKWKNVDILNDYSTEVLSFFTSMSYNVIKSMNENHLKSSYASELKRMFYNYFDVDIFKKLPTDISNKLSYISGCACLIRN